MIFRKCEKGEENAVLGLYKSVIGSEFCVWDDEYTTMREISCDM